MEFQKISERKTEKAAFKYLITEKEKQTKISNIEYKKRKIQEYLGGGCGNLKLAKLIFKARSQTLDIKTQRTWKYSDNLCTGCNLKEETGQQILVCDQFNGRNITSNDSAKYSDIYSENVIDIVKTGKILRYNLKRRQEILEAGVT